MVDARQQMCRSCGEEDRGLVPRDWQPIRRNFAGQDETLAVGVLPTDGKRIHVTTAAGATQELGADQFIERVVLLS
jgi:hypothetical protein